MIYYVVVLINSLPNKNGVSKKYSPREIVTRRKMEFKNHCICEFGEYVKSRGDYVVTRNMTPRTHEAISLGTSGNLQVIHKVFCIKTGLVLNRHLNKVVPMPYLVIKKMNQCG